MSRLPTIFALVLLFTCIGALAVNDSFDVDASPDEVRRAMNQLGAAGLMRIPGPLCLKSFLVSGGVSETGRVFFSAGNGLLGTATGQLYQNADGTTHVQIEASVVSDGLHRTVMGTPDDLARKILRQVEANRRG
ncbi:MAG: hypothetical protein H6617_07915 [Bdellovibrionaceae bacterium]|nr:hypothetical protein [Bdellovibrionales bacterium]MCB9254592.1 hypothetical protein [Pseudobdellovibrionaceae bacterium]